MGVIIGVIVGLGTLLAGAAIGWGVATILLAMREDQYDIWDEDTW